MLFIIPLAYSALGAFSMVMQTILLREFFVVAAGNEISFGIAMGGWLLGVGAGSICGAFFSARRSRTATAFSWTALALAAAAPLLLATVRCLHLLGVISQGTLLPLAKTFYLIPLLTMPFSFMSGFAFPLAAKLRPQSEENRPRLLVGAYVWECLGALAGGMAYTFWLVEKYDPLLIILLFTLPLLIGSGWVALVPARDKKNLALHLLALTLTLAAIFSGGAGRIDSWLVRQRWLGISSSDLIANRDSKYQNLQLGLRHGQYNLYSNGQLAAVFPDDDPQRILAAQIISQHPSPRDILVIGSASSGLAKHLLRYKIARLTTVEIDAEFSDLISEHLNASDRAALRDPRLRMLIMDGRRFVKLAARAGSESQRFDLAFINQPDALTAQLNRYYTREFFKDLKKILTPGGVVALRLSASENYASDIINPYTSVIFQTLKSVFPFIAVSPGPTSAFFASAEEAIVTTESQVLAERYRALVLAPGGLGRIFTSLYPLEKTAAISAALQKHKARELNRDQRPIAYFLGGRMLGWSSGSPLTGLFRLLGKVKFTIVLMIMGLLLLPVFLLTLFRRKKQVGLAQILPAAASGGFAGLSFEITAIFIFQNTWGFVYQAIGLLIALFMLGLGAGAALANRNIEKKLPTAEQAARWLAGIQMLIAVLNLGCLPLLRINFRLGWPGQFLLAAWLGGMGLLVGAILPLGMRVMRRMPAGLSAGLLNAGDYLGGAIGSLVMAAFFLPLLGTGNSLLLISLLSLVSAALLLLAAGSGPRPTCKQ
ncbi:MAG: fused MFS/spermidine synthase [Candidatus Aminicenantes bacterium]|nr:fused MFS/spermidine synthase [Candidatus Aminicenantes bacterium]